MKDKFYILVVDDEPDICDLVRQILEDEGFQVRVAHNGAQARQQVIDHKPDLVLLDVWMPDEDGISLLGHWKGHGKLPFPVIIMSGHGTIETAVEATRLGASLFIEKPLTTAKLLQAVNIILPSEAHQQHVHIPAGTSEFSKNLRKNAKEIAETKVTTVISGPAGSGKLDFALYIHSLSEYADLPPIIIDESYLFAHLPNDTAWGSVIIKNISIHSRDKQQQLAEVIATAQQNKVDFRIILTDQMGLESLADKKLLVEELSILTSGRQITIPPLNERSEDIPDLIGACVDYHCQKEKLPYRRCSIAAQNFLVHYSWPGNMRELDHLIMRFLKADSKEQITLEEVRSCLRNVGDNSDDGIKADYLSLPFREARAEFEKVYLEHRLKEAGGSVARLAVIADLERTQLYRKLKSLGIHLNEREGKQ